jgi:hypothetical protein
MVSCQQKVGGGDFGGEVGAGRRSRLLVLKDLAQEGGDWLGWLVA